MKNVDGQRLVSEFTIPGTHDSATYNVFQITGFGYVKCQSLSILDQLEIGCRFLDIRLQTFNKKNLLLYHGSWSLHLDLNDVLNHCRSFLKRNPSESILMCIKPEEGSDISQTFMQYYYNKDPTIWYIENTIPKLNDVRGRIVLLRRFFAPIGINLPISDNCRSCHLICYDQQHHHPEYLVCEDRYNPDSLEEKCQNIAENILQAEKNKNPNILFLTFTSAYIALRFTPKGMSRRINPWMLSCPQVKKKNKGIVVMDFINSKITDFLIKDY